MLNWIKSNWKALAIGVLAITFVIAVMSDRADSRVAKIRDDLNFKLASSNAAVAVLQSTVAAKEGENSVLLGRQDSLEKVIADMEANPKVILKPVETIKTITVEKVEYVPKTEYVTLYESCQFSLAIKQKYREYIDTSKTIEQNFDLTVTSLKGIVAEKDKQVGDLKVAFDKVSKIAVRKWSITIGPGAGLLTSATNSWQVKFMPVVIVVGYRIL